MALSIEQVDKRVLSLKTRYAARDARMGDVYAVRRGDLSAIGSDLFPEGFDHAMVANLIDVSAKDTSEVLAPLPTISCQAPANTTSEREKRKADIRTQIANHYVQHSDVESQQYTGADWYLSYGFQPIKVEPDYEAGMPRITYVNPIGCYIERDRFNRPIYMANRYQKTVAELCADFPEYESKIIGQYHSFETVDWNTRLELIRYEDKDQVLLYLPDRDNLVLSSAPNPMGKVCVSVAWRPDIDPSDPRGQYDDVIWVQLARARFGFLHMEAVEKSVQAPIAVPSDVQDFSLGADAIIRTQNPGAIRRVGLELPSGAFTETQVLEQELRLGARYPQGRSGQIDASVITGQGVQALLGGFDTQVKTGQQVFARALEKAVALCFEMDEKLFDNEKEVSSLYNGAPYKLSYRPSKDIAGDYTVQVRYGLMSGLDPSRALIFSLQALQANLISREFVMHELPWSMNVSEVQKAIEVERMRDQLAGSFAAMSQAIPQMAAQGQDPSKIVKQIADVIAMRKSGTNIEDAVQKVFMPEPPPTPNVSPAVSQMAPVEQMAQTAAPGAAPAGEPTSPAPEAAGQPQQAAPDMAQILAMMGGGGQ